MLPLARSPCFIGLFPPAVPTCSHQAMSARKMAGKDKATIAKEAQEEASNKQAAAEAAAKEATKLEAAAKVRWMGRWMGWG